MTTPRPRGKTAPRPAGSTRGRWLDGALPPNARVGAHTIITGPDVFKRFFGTDPLALSIGARCTMDGVHFGIGRTGRVSIGDYCYFTNPLLLCELEIDIGSYVVIGWNATVADTDFHPIDPAERIADAIACSPLGQGRPRPATIRRKVVIEDGVWIGPNATILKGVRIGAGALVEPGAMVTRDVAPRTRVMGNPARSVGRI